MRHDARDEDDFAEYMEVFTAYFAAHIESGEIEVGDRTTDEILANLSDHWAAFLSSDPTDEAFQLRPVLTIVSLLLNRRGVDQRGRNYSIRHLHRARRKRTSSNAA